ncbi:glucokinase [Herbidospora sp. RD11066]
MSYPWLVADIGGTNARFGIVSGPGAAPEAVAVLNVAEHPGLPDAVSAYLTDHTDGARPGAVCVAIAGPVKGDHYTLTNGSWTGSINDLGIPQAAVLNDFEALAISLPHLAGDDLVPLGGPAPSAGMVKAVLGPGTGLGVAGLVPAGDGWVPVPGEGGHVSVPAVTDLEFEIVKALRSDGLPYVDAEHLLSGSGLPRLHRGLSLVRGIKATRKSASEIVAGDDDVCRETIEVFLALLGGFAGNVALTLGARGGVYLGGGVLPRIVERVRDSDFRARFELTGPALSDYLTAIATSLIVAEQPALTGAAAWLQQRATSVEYV